MSSPGPCQTISEFTAVDAAVTPTALIGYLGVTNACPA
jgi:hypothetical protein